MYLLSRRDVESKAFVLCGSVEGHERTALVGRAVILVPERAYEARTATRVVTSREFILPLLLRCAGEGLSCLEAHTHPWAEEACFSGIDDRSDAGKFRETEALPAPFRHATAVFGSGMGFSARLWDRGLKRAVPVSRLTVVDAPLRFHRAQGSAPEALSDHQAAVFDRQVRAFGADGQAMLRDMTVAVVGAGGMGSEIDQTLALLGVGHLILIDPDALEESNANRVVAVSGRDIGAGRPKVEAIAATLSALCEPPRVTAVPADVRERKVWPHLASADLIVGAVDSAAARHFLNAFCACALIPYIDAGVGIAVQDGKVEAAGGQVRTVLPGTTPCLSCLDRELSERAAEEQAPEERELSRAAGYIHGERVPRPQVAFLNGVVAHALAWEVVKLATGCLSVAPYVEYDLAQPALYPVVGAQRDPDCLVCSPAGLLGMGEAGLSGLDRERSGARVPLPESDKEENDGGDTE
ncbi:MAG TPA: ThiF family adenylyltransferase [Armatimonadota bacterium]